MFATLLSLHDVENFHSGIYKKYERRFQNSLLFKFTKIISTKRRHKSGIYNLLPFQGNYAGYITEIRTRSSLS